MVEGFFWRGAATLTSTVLPWIKQFTHFCLFNLRIAMRNACAFVSFPHSGSRVRLNFSSSRTSSALSLNDITFGSGLLMATIYRVYICVSM